MLRIFSNDSVKKAIFRNLDLSFNKTGLVFICGKKESSAKNLLKYIGGIDYLEGLNIEIDGELINTEKQLDDYRLYNVGFVFSNVYYAEGQTVAANALSGSSLFADVITDEYLDSCLQRVGLLEFKNSKVEELSEYQLHCLDIARALVKDPKIIIANNPIARLNEEEVAKIWDIIKDLSNDYLVFVGNALEALGKQIANEVISFESHEINHSLVENIIHNKIKPAVSKGLDPVYPKKNKLSFVNQLRISSKLLPGSIFLMVLMVLTFTGFLISFSSQANAHYNFAEALQDNNIQKVILMRNTTKQDYFIKEEVRNDLDTHFKDIEIQWGYYLQNDVNKIFKAHKNGTKYNYPESLFRIDDGDKDNLYKLKKGSWDDDQTGVYISESSAKKYIEYFNNWKNSKVKHAEIFVNVVHNVYKSDLDTDGNCTVKFNSIDDLVGQYLILAYNTKHLQVLKVSGIFEDNRYKDNLLITKNYKFEKTAAECYDGTTTKLPEFDQSKFFSIGVVTLTNDILRNTDFLNYSANIIRNEREPLLIKTDLDEAYTPLIKGIHSIPTPLNIVTIILFLLTISSSFILNYIMITNYRKEFTLARTFGLKKEEITKINALQYTFIGIISFVASLLLSLLIILFVNLGIKGSHEFVNFMYISIPWYYILIVFGATVVLTGLFIFFASRAIKKHDYLIY